MLETILRRLKSLSQVFLGLLRFRIALEYTCDITGMYYSLYLLPRVFCFKKKLSDSYAKSIIHLVSEKEVCKQHWSVQSLLLRLQTDIVIYQPLPSQRTGPGMRIHKDIPRKNRWRKPEERKQHKNEESWRVKKIRKGEVKIIAKPWTTALIMKNPQYIAQTQEEMQINIITEFYSHSHLDLPCIIC